MKRKPTCAAPTQQNESKSAVAQGASQNVCRLSAAGPHRKGKWLIRAGLLLITAALFLTVYNLYDNQRAEKSAMCAVNQLEKMIPSAEVVSSENVSAPSGELEIPDYILNPEMDMPLKNIEGIDYIGVLRIPALGLELPVISQWSYPNLKIAPCRYEGSAYLDNLIIAAHNYASHFGTLKNLRQGDEVVVTDMDGNIFHYEVTEVELLQPTAVEKMESGDWALTLFTCTFDGQSRVTVRCIAIDE